MLKESICNLCGANRYQVLYQSVNKGKEEFEDFVYTITDNRITLPPRIVRCLNCGLIYANPEIKIKELYFSYKNMVDETYLHEEKGRRLSARIMLHRIMEFKRGGKFLDIGCAAGLLLDEARKLGWETYGVELSRWAVKIAKERFNLELFEGLLKDAKYPNIFFDVVIMVDVIEHLPDPLGTLKEIRRILKPDGLLCVCTPDIYSLISRLLKAKWWGLKRSHIFYFSKQSLTKMLAAVGFNVIKYRSHIRVFSFRYLNKRLESYHAFLYFLFRNLTRFFSLADKLIKINLGDQIAVYARKRLSLLDLQEDERQIEREIVKKMKTVVVLPAYNAAKTLAATVKDIPKDTVDDIILVDDASQDNTAQIAKGLGLKVFTHFKNKGYGANQKTCYTKALEMGADIVVMVHPDYQYDPEVIPDIIRPIKKGEADAVFGSRMMKGGALEGGMPLWKHNANILLTALENVLLGTYLTEYHSGFRAYSARYLKSVNFMDNSDGFIFDTEIIIQGLLHNLKIEETPIHTRYFDEASTIKFWSCLLYGLGILKTLFKYILHTKWIIRFKQFE